MGLRGLENKNPRDMERERREEQRRNEARHGDTRVNAEKRSLEKAQEILQDQAGDMSAYNKTIASGGMISECDNVCRSKVEKIMSGRVAVLSFDDTLLTAQGIFSSAKFRHLPIVDEVGNITGIISDRDVLRLSSPFFGTINEQHRDREIMSRKVGVIMTRNPVCIDIGETVINAVRLMNHWKISCLPVVENGGAKLLGIVTWKDVVRAFCPAGFSQNSESSRIKTGVHVDPEATESARLRAMSARTQRGGPDEERARRLETTESERLRAIEERAKKPEA